MQLPGKKVAPGLLLAVLILTQVAAGDPFRTLRIRTANSQPEGITVGPHRRKVPRLQIPWPRSG